MNGGYLGRTPAEAESATLFRRTLVHGLGPCMGMRHEGQYADHLTGKRWDRTGTLDCAARSSFLCVSLRLLLASVFGASIALAAVVRV